MLTLEFLAGPHGRVPGFARKIMKDIVKRVPRITEIKHDLAVKVVPALTVTDGQGGYGFGAFIYHEVPGKEEEQGLVIFIPGHKIPDLANNEWPAFLAMNFLHEVAHYEQYRDGRPVVDDAAIEERVEELLKMLETNA
jgi:hypothetical protein